LENPHLYYHQRRSETEEKRFLSKVVEDKILGTISKNDYSVGDIVDEGIKMYPVPTEESDFDRYKRKINRVIEGMKMREVRKVGKTHYYSRTQVDYLFYYDSELHEYFTDNSNYSFKESDRFNYLKYDDIYKEVEAAIYGWYNDDMMDEDEYFGLLKGVKSERTITRDKKEAFDQIVEEAYEKKKLNIMISALFNSQYILDRGLFHHDLKGWFKSNKGYLPYVKYRDDFDFTNKNEFLSMLYKKRLENPKNYYGVRKKTKED
jgi:hypothetical protein